MLQVNSNAIYYSNVLFTHYSTLIIGNTDLLSRKLNSYVSNFKLPCCKFVQASKVNAA